jgi:hypothetical protein
MNLLWRRHELLITSSLFYQYGVVRSEEERCNAPVLIRSIFQFDNADCRANSWISPTPIVGLIPLLNRATPSAWLRASPSTPSAPSTWLRASWLRASWLRASLVPHLSPTIGTIRSLNTNCQDAMQSLLSIPSWFGASFNLTTPSISILRVRIQKSAFIYSPLLPNPPLITDYWLLNTEKLPLYFFNRMGKHRAGFSRV